MKTLNFYEIKSLVDVLQEKLPAQLQEVSSTERGLALSMFSRQGTGGAWWLFLDLNPLRPGFYFQEDRDPWPAKKKSTPVGLFLNSHAKGLYLKHVDLIEEYGRVVQFIFGNTSKEVVVQQEIIPRLPNILVTTNDGKKISWFKPRERQEMSPPEVSEARSTHQVMKEWRESFSNKEPEAHNPIAQIIKQRLRDLEKKKKALAEIEKALTSEDHIKWFELGELLKWKPLSEIGQDWAPFLDSKLSQQENRERAFKKGKQLQEKKDGTLRRKEILLKEISELEMSPDASNQIAVAPKSKVPKIKDTKLRTKTLESGFVVHMGKSAQDNIKLLRQSQPWDYWVHLRDYPSSHAILHRNKNQNIPHKDIEEVGQWLAQASLTSKQVSLGQRLDIIFAECRYVKPIKGDKLGRVNYQNETTLTIRLQK